MKLTIGHLYPDLLNAYGDVGNIIILKDRLRRRDILVEVVSISINDTFCPQDYDILLFGGGQDFEQTIVSEDLLTHKADALKQYIESGGVLLAICGGYQLLGEHYINQENKKVDGLKALPIYTVAGDVRFIGDLIIEDRKEHHYVGFENHSGRTYINGLKPLGYVLKGYGNNGEDGTEGCRYLNTYCTYLHGPILSKNPELADELILKALSKRYNITSLEPIDDTYPLNAKKVIMKRLHKKGTLSNSGV